PRFAPSGLRASSFTIGYGMAENVMSATQMSDEPVRVDWIALHELQTSGRAVPAQPDSPAALPVVGNGSPLEGTEIRIIDEQGVQLEERRLGEILVRSPHLMSGYY